MWRLTIPYNISLYGVKEQMKEHFQWLGASGRGTDAIKNKIKKCGAKVPKELTFNNECLYLYPSEVSKLGEIVAP